MRYALLAFAAGALSSAAIAQDPPAPTAMPSPKDVLGRDTLTVGVGAGILPDYEGSDDYRIIPIGAVRGQYHGISFSTRGAYLYVDVVPDRGNKVELIAGPVAGLRMNKRNHVDDDTVKLLPRLKTAVELGGFAGVSFHGLTNPYDTLSVRIDALHDVGGAHESTVLSPNVDFSTPLSRSTYVSASLGLEFVGNKFADYYYTITPAASLATGGRIAPFKADGGLKSWKAGLLLNQSLTGDLLHGLSVFGAGQYSHLEGDFKRSPIVSQRGSASQWLGALGLAYTW